MTYFVDCLRRISLVWFFVILSIFVSMVFIAAVYVPWPWIIPYLLLILLFVVGALFVATEIRPL